MCWVSVCTIVGGMRLESKFTRKQWLSGILPEVMSARSVLASADRLLRQDGPLERELDAVLATYSIGVERLMKLALGTAAVSRGEDWPQMGSTRNGWGHALDEMEQLLRTTFREAVADGSWDHKRLLETWVCTLDNDPIWAEAIRALRNYADRGRYHHLDQIGGGEVKSLSSSETWEQVQRVAIDNDPLLAEHYKRACSGEAVEPFESELRATVADALKRWVSIVCLFGLHGVLGDDWGSIGADALPEGAVLVKTLAQCDACSLSSRLPGGACLRLLENSMPSEQV
jgi:hypothetical protein